MSLTHGPGETFRPTILLVEDDAGVRRSLQLLLRAQGYEVKAYFDGQPLLSDERSMDAACLIADYRLPDANGLAILSMLRERGWERPAILITAFPSSDLEDKAHAAGFDLVLEKPLRPQVLVSLVERLVPLA